MQLRTDDFQFNDIKLSEIELENGKFMVVNTSNSSNTRKIGLTRSLSTTEGVRGNRVISEISETTQQITIVITKLDDKSMPLSITDDDLKQLTTWLFSPTEYKKLVALDEEAPIIYYGMFTDGEQTYLNKNNQGYITLTFELDSNHAYQLYEEEFIVHETREIQLTYNGNIDKYCYPDIKFEVTGTSFSIENRSMQEIVTFEKLDNKSNRGTIYGDGMMTVISDIDNKVNMRAKTNRKFLRLQYGVNRIVINGEGKFTISYQSKISLR